MPSVYADIVCMLLFCLYVCSMWDSDGDGRLNQAEFTDVLRALDVQVDDPQTGAQTLVNVAREAGVNSPLVTFEQASV